MRTVTMEKRRETAKCTRIVLISFLAVVAFASQGSGSEAEIPKGSCAEFRIVLEKQQYFVGEDVWLRAVLENTCQDSQPVVAFTYLYEGISIELLDSNLERLPMFAVSLARGWRSEQEISLAGGDSLGLFVSFVHTHGQSTVFNGNIRLLKPGSYHVFCQCHLPDGMTVASETLHFEVVEPEEIQLVALNRLRQLDHNFDDVEFDSYLDWQRQEMRHLVEDYPEAYFASRILSDLMIQRPASMPEAAWPLINDYPDSPWADRALKFLLVGRYVDGPELLKELADAKKDSHLRRVARGLLADRRPIATSPGGLLRLAREIQAER